MKNTSLIINDSLAGEKKVTETVERTGLFEQIIFSCGGPEAISQLQNHDVDMVFYNWGVSADEDALELLRSLRRKEEWVDIPAILFTDDSDIEKRMTALENGASDCLGYRTSTDELRVRGLQHLRLKERADELRRKNRELSAMALIDPLTGLFNRGYFDASLASEVAGTRRSGTPFSLLLLDLDHFKSINDNHGHQAGDSALKAVARLLKDSTRESNPVCRYGGEEFAVILRDTPISKAYLIAERLRKQIAALTLGERRGEVPLSATIGISEGCGSEAGSPNQIIEEADRALYAGKRNGRNRTEIFKTPTAKPSWQLFPGRIDAAVGYA